jgi:hypothetical protein
MPRREHTRMEPRSAGPSRSIPRPQTRQHFREIFRADVKMLADPPPQHRGRHVAASALQLRLLHYVQDHPLLAGQAITNVRQCVVASVSTVVRR